MMLISGEGGLLSFQSEGELCEKYEAGALEASLQGRANRLHSW